MEHNIENILNIVQNNFNLKAEITKSYNNNDCVLIRKGKLEATLSYGKSINFATNEYEDDIRISWNNKAEWSGGCYGTLLSKDSEENIVKEMITRVFKIDASPQNIQLSFF